MAKKKTRDIEFDFFNIDINNLDKEWINQPKIFFKYASELADAMRRESGARTEREVVKAEIDLKVRENLKKYGIDKVKLTEAVILGVVSSQPKYKEAQKKRLIRKHKTDILQAAVRALDHRKSALERLVSLHGQNYFSTPKPIDARSMEATSDIEKGAARLAGKKRKKGKGSRK